MFNLINVKTMANFSEMMGNTPNVFNFIPEGNRFNSNNDFASLLNLARGGNGFGNDQWGVWMMFLLVMCGWGGFGYGNRGFNNGTPEIQSALSNEYLLTAINAASKDTNSFVQSLASQLNCDVNAIQGAINNIASTVGLGQKDIINQICSSNSAIMSTVQSTGCSIEQAINQCCCTTQRSIDAVNLNLTNLGYQEQLRTLEQTSALTNNMNNGFASLGSKIDNQTIAMNQGFQSIKDMMCEFKVENLQQKNAELANNVQTLQQYNAIQALINPLSQKLSYLECAIPPRPVPAYPAHPYYGCCAQSSTPTTPTSAA